MTTRVPFSGLAPDGRIARAGGELVAFDVDNAIALGEALRRQTGPGESVTALGERLVNAVHSFDEMNRPACVLVRAFTADAAGLHLVAARGIEKAWNGVGATAVQQPFIHDLPRLLRLGDAARSPVTSLHIADPLTTPAIPAKDFVRAYDVRTAFAFATMLTPELTLLVTAFARVVVPRRTTRLFELLGLYVKIGSKSVDDAARLEALEELIVLQGVLTREALFENRRRMESESATAREGAASAEARARAQGQELRRSQRAMLNVIEDLRVARNSLATTVEERTLELASANRQLSARNQELEEFVYIASHDLQEPLRTVSGYLQMIERRHGDKLGPEGDEFIQFAIQGAQRMQALIESLLFYSRIASAEKTTDAVPLDEPLDIALRNLALRIEETKATLTRDPLPTVQADRMQMVQVFQNLVGNAIKFAGPNPPRIYVSGQVVDEVAAIAVRDEGIGFNPKFAERIFKVFRRLRRDTEGTGIGLAVCKKIMDRHGGRISATSTPGAGATFTIELPIHSSEKLS